jgi:hypothetical protein
MRSSFALVDPAFQPLRRRSINRETFETRNHNNKRMGKSAREEHKYDLGYNVAPKHFLNRN